MQTGPIDLLVRSFPSKLCQYFLQVKGFFYVCNFVPVFEQLGIVNISYLLHSAKWSAEFHIKLGQRFCTKLKTSFCPKMSFSQKTISCESFKLVNHLFLGHYRSCTIWLEGSISYNRPMCVWVGECECVCVRLSEWTCRGMRACVWERKRRIEWPAQMRSQIEKAKWMDQ